MAAFVLLDSLQNHLFNDIYFFKKVFINLSYYTGTFLVGTHGFGVSFPKLKTFSGIFWVLPIDCSLYEKTILGIFVFLHISEVTITKVNFRFYKQCNQAATLLPICERAIFAQNASIIFWLQNSFIL